MSSPFYQTFQAKSPLQKKEKLTDEEAGFEKNTTRDLRDGTSNISASPSSTVTWRREQARIKKQSESAEERKAKLKAKRDAKKKAK